MTYFYIQNVIPYITKINKYLIKIQETMRNETDSDCLTAVETDEICTKCGLKFGNRTLLSTHMYKHIWHFQPKVNLQRIDGIIVNEKINPPYTNTSTARPKTHKIVSRNKIRYYCKICSSSFSKENSL